MSKQRTSLVDMGRMAAKAKAAERLPALTEDATRAPGVASEDKTATMTTTAVHIPHATLVLLRRVAVERANRQGGRPSVSAVLVALVEGQRDALEAELAAAR